jgi:hypothetical protein
LKIQGAPNRYLHFCGLKVWAIAGDLDEVEEVSAVSGQRVNFKNEMISMSTYWKDDRMKPWNVIKTENFNARWGYGEFTCVHSLNDADGPWWKANFGM